MPNAEHLRKYQFKPGESGNKNGRPKKVDKQLRDGVIQVIEAFLKKERQQNKQPHHE